MPNNIWREDDVIKLSHYLKISNVYMSSFNDQR
jgi:hypothetical protein